MELPQDLGQTQHEAIGTPEGSRPDLRLITGGLAVEQSVVTVPNISDMPEEDFRALIHAKAFEANSLGSLTELNHQINEEVTRLSLEEAELTRRLHELYHRKLWLHGYINDRKQQ